MNITITTKCPCETYSRVCCACVSMHCDKCNDYSEFKQGRYCSNCGRPLKAELSRNYVPKSEYDELKTMLDAAVAGQETLQKALAEVKSNNEIRGESFYFELEKLEERGKQLEREHDAEVARRIFEEMEQSTFGDSTANLIIMPTKDFTKLKKKFFVAEQYIAQEQFCVAEQDSDSRQTVENEKKYMEGTANDRH